MRLENCCVKTVVKCAIVQKDLGDREMLPKMSENQSLIRRLEIKIIPRTVTGVKIMSSLRGFVVTTSCHCSGYRSGQV